MEQRQADAAQPGNRQATAEQLQAELERAQREIEELRDKYLRTAAEVDNTRKWTAREVAARATKTQRDLLRQLLEVTDNLERVLEVPADQPAILEGIRITLRQLERVLENSGVRRLEVQPGEAFDPQYHEAVDVHGGNVDRPEVYDVVQPGYMHDDSLLRPARVIVQK